jgi:hypothetical protein
MSRSGIETVGVAVLPESGNLSGVSQAFSSSPSSMEAWKTLMPRFKELEHVLAWKSE